MIPSTSARPAWAGLFPALTIAVAALSVLALALPRPGGFGEPRYTLRLDPPPAAQPAVAVVPAMRVQPDDSETAAGQVPAPTLLRSVPRAPVTVEAATSAMPAAPRPQPADAEPAVSVSMPSQSGESTASITAITLPGAVASPTEDRMIGLGAGAVGRTAAASQAPEAAVGGEPLPTLVTPVVPVSGGQSAGEVAQASPGAASQGAAPPSVLPGLPEEAPKPARAAKVKAKAKPAAAIASEPAAKPQKAKAAKTARKPVAAAKKPSVFKSEEGRR